jgi:hypothetical protein
LKRPIGAAERYSPPQTADRSVIWFFVKSGDRTRRRCGVVVDALAILDPRLDILDLAACRRTFGEHRNWIKTLAQIELTEHEVKGTLVLTPAHVRFQLGCDESGDIPDVLCI